MNLQGTYDTFESAAICFAALSSVYPSTTRFDRPDMLAAMKESAQSLTDSALALLDELENYDA